MGKKTFTRIVDHMFPSRDKYYHSCWRTLPEEVFDYPEARKKMLANRSGWSLYFSR